MEAVRARVEEKPRERWGSGAPVNEAACWVCEGRTRAFWKNEAFESIACVACGHLQAAHRVDPEAASVDYHLGYDQEAFVTALATTRRRQARRVLDALPSQSRPSSLFDFGCGRGWFLEVARERGITQLGGGDTSEVALELLRQRGMLAVKLDAAQPFEHLDFNRLGFAPEVITFLDVLEHFEGDLARRLSPWLAALPKAVRYVVIKVPMRDGLLFTTADLARHVGVAGLGKQLFQCGTYPPHYQYFTRRSLDRFVARLGLSPSAVLDDLDFEPEGLGSRLSSSGALIRRLAPLAGELLGAAARGLKRADSRIVIAERRAPE